MSCEIREMELAHAHSDRHRDEVLRSSRCACFHCQETFGPADIRDWIDGRQTALCPRCGVDAVLGDASGLALDAAFLGAMRRHWFES